VARKDLMDAVRADDLERSGLHKPSVMKKLGYGAMLSQVQTAADTGIDNAVSYLVPYYSPMGEDLKYHRWKLFPLTDEDIGIRYTQVDKTIPRLYLPPLINWKAFCADTSKRLIITEGEKKAACATNMGLPTIALGGVWSFTSKKWHLKEIDDWKWFDMKGREVEVCYDGDMYTNENVSRALHALTAMLTRKGARVFVRHLPTMDGLSKLDDFLVAKGVKEYLKLNVAEAPNSELMSQLNEDLCYIKDTQTYFSTHDRILYGDVGRLKRNYGSLKITAESGKQISAVDEWAQWPFMRKVDRMTYAPGKPMFTDGELNDWPGWGVEPRRGNVGQFLEVIKSIDGWEWLLKWLAYPIQNPGAKMFSAVMIWSVQQGTGKTFIGDVMRDIYGRNANVITSVELHDDSFVWLRNKQFILGEEVSQRRSIADSGLLKHIITNDTVTINEKYVPTYDLPNCANLMFTSNKPDAIIMDQSDRRFFVGKLDQHQPLKFWKQLDKWRKRDGGPAAFMHYLQHRVSLEDFNPLAPPPDTSDKRMMQDAGLTSSQQWVKELMEDPEAMLAEALGDKKMAREAMKRDVFPLTTIMDWIPGDLERTLNRTSLSNSLVMFGAVRNGSPVRLTRGGQVRLIAIKNVELWRKRIGQNKEWATNFEGKTAPKVAKKVTAIGTRKRRKG